MQAKFVILGLINLVFWVAFIIYSLAFEITPFLGGMAISFSISTFIGVISSLQTLFISIFLAWGLYFLGVFEATPWHPHPFIAGCATALTLGITLGFIISRPL